MGPVSHAGGLTLLWQGDELGNGSGTLQSAQFTAGSGSVVQPSDTVSMQTAGGLLYLIAAPIGSSGIAILGDLGQFVTAGKKRITAMGDYGVAHVNVAFANSEKSRILTGYSPSAPIARASVGTVGPVKFDAAKQLFQLAVSPGADGTASLRIELPRARIPLKPALPNGSIQ